VNIINKSIKWIMIIAGAITCSMIFAAIAPEAALMNTFGASIQQGPLVDIVVRSWGVLITLMGLMLIYGAYRPQYRSLVLTVSAASKLAFVLLILVYGADYMDKAMPTVIFDTLVSLIFVVYLLANRANAGPANDS
jgi:hypothetical protein